jgi:hypothetical protein
VPRAGEALALREAEAAVEAGRRLDAQPAAAAAQAALDVLEVAHHVSLGRPAGAGQVLRRGGPGAERLEQPLADGALRAGRRHVSPRGGAGR